MTVGLPPSITATTEFVVPRSMPITFAMSVYPFSLRSRAPALPALQDVDLDLAGLELFRLRQPYLEDPVAVAGLHLVGLDGQRQLDQPLELSVHALDVEELLVAVLLLVPAPLTTDAQQVARDRDGHVLLTNAGQLHLQHEVVLRLVHVDRGKPRPRRLCASGRRPPEEVVEQPVHLALDVDEVAERLPPIRRPVLTPTLHRHVSPP